MFKLILFVLFSMSVLKSFAGVIIESGWNESFRKELSISCTPEEEFCSLVCGQEAHRQIEESYCRDCIGTGLRVTHLISELGRSISSTGKFSERLEVSELLRSGAFVTLSVDDAYNVIDPAQSLRHYRKFESLCPGSFKQIIFLKVDQLDRSLERPLYVYCEAEEGTQILNLTIESEVIIREKQRSDIHH